MRISDWSSDVCSSDLWIDAVLPICDSAHEGGRGRLYCQHRVRLGPAGRRVPRCLRHVPGGVHLPDPLSFHSSWPASHSFHRLPAVTPRNPSYALPPLPSFLFYSSSLSPVFTLHSFQF